MDGMIDLYEVARHHREQMLCEAEPPGKRVAILSQEACRSAIASGLGAEEGRRPSPHALEGIEECRLGGRR